MKQHTNTQDYLARAGHFHWKVQALLADRTEPKCSSLFLVKYLHHSAAWPREAATPYRQLRDCPAMFRAEWFCFYFLLDDRDTFFARIIKHSEETPTQIVFIYKLLKKQTFLSGFII